MKIVCHIPVRAGSKRTPNKNIRKIGSKRVVEYVIGAAIEANIFDEIWLNTDSQLLMNEHKQGLLNNSSLFNVYQRPEQLCSDRATSDEFNYDFAQFTDADIMVMLNPVCPLLASETVRLAIDELKSKSSEYDTLITCTSTKMQVFYDNNPLNIKDDEALQPSQENGKVSTLNWAVTAWMRKDFIERYLNQGFAVLGTNRILYDIEPVEGLKISEESDFEIITSIINGRNQQNK